MINFRGWSPRPRILATSGVAVLAGCLAVSGCSAVQKANKVRHDLEGNSATIKTFSQSLKNGEAKPFQAVYVTTGSSPAKIVYAVQPPNDVLFRSTAHGSTPAVNLIINSSGNYACSSAFDQGSTAQTSTKGVTCESVTGVTAKADKAIVDLYSPSHWVTFLHGFSLAAGFAGDKVTTSTMSLGGQSLSCVDFHAPGTPGQSKICTTPQGVLGYVKVAGDATSFELQSYQATPPASDFQLPAGAKIKKVSIKN
jgi:hypothetical protein